LNENPGDRTGPRCGPVLCSRHRRGMLGSSRKRGVALDGVFDAKMYRRSRSGCHDAVLGLVVRGPNRCAFCCGSASRDTRSTCVESRRVRCAPPLPASPPLRLSPLLLRPSLLLLARTVLAAVVRRLEFVVSGTST